MATTSFFSLFRLLPVVFLFGACSRIGCNDNRAENYEPRATKPCGCCFYSAQIKVWCDYAPSITTSIKIFVDGVMEREISNMANVHDYSPYDESYASRSVLLKDNIVTLSLGPEKMKTVKVRVVNQTNFTIFSDTVTIKAARLKPIKIFP